MHKLGAAVVVLLSLLDRPVWGAEYRITVGSGKVTGYVTHFWRSTGFWCVQLRTELHTRYTLRYIVSMLRRTLVPFTKLQAPAACN